MKRKLYNDVIAEMLGLDYHGNWNYMFWETDDLADGINSDDDPNWEGVAEDLEQILDCMEDEYYYLYNAMPKLKTLIEVLREE